MVKSPSSKCLLEVSDKHNIKVSVLLGLYHPVDSDGVYLFRDDVIVCEVEWCISILVLFRWYACRSRGYL
ncbi:hypothetical protein PTT_16876 [Pyrenophora teres f. teres 0-1]|uniref:Uncharacterized protein n=1 Tax=Pyrenophora teres f. teres (strain 0-1) TaxID=861557 RepID=E3S369_PYRTT|nr:hypothetical protein PTT_16876 [Pyrenophora teres f. teres 0-1]